MKPKQPWLPRLFLPARVQNFIADANSTSTDQINNAAVAVYTTGYITALPLLAYPVVLAFDLESRFKTEGIFE